jgi:hypothetical protein
MGDFQGYAVFLHEQAIEVFGEAIKPYLSDGERGTHILCREIDTSGAFVEMTLDGHGPDGRSVDIELMVPGNAVRMIVSARSDGEFGFAPRSSAPGVIVEPGLPAVGPTAAPADAPPQQLPESTQPADAPVRTPAKP